MIPPHPLGCSIEFCDFCDHGSQKGDISYITIDGPYFGWFCCESKECREQLESTRTKFTIPIADLKSELGDDLKVLRSKGVFQCRWTIMSDACMDEEGDYLVWVQVIENYEKPVQIKKKVKLDDLRKWQKKYERV